MLVFNCTKAAADFFTTVRKGNKLSPMSPVPKKKFIDEPVLHSHQQWHWMVHVKKIARRNVLLAMDMDSRFCMIFWGIKKGNVQSFLEQFHDRLGLHVVSVINLGGQDESISKKSMDSFVESHHEYAFVQRGDRSVQAHIKDVFFNFQYEQFRWEDDIPTEEELFFSDLRHNDTPRRRRHDKDYIFPTEIMFMTWLSRYANVDEQTIAHAMSQFRFKSRELLWGKIYSDLDELNLGE
ncbi:DUF6933 domain-containing protein [Legionella londiniensis]|uniref:DUF6933 domain-containing protein n=1 Tax=Legionella londiniensis TaxID=45068 RepID=A0A0W0VJT9_9GAMM|nr:hypothetical protein [Legionella londiniensis]KTD20373.1 hypothetical protein Llon_1726 [Legionella londiniensis]STX93976.1 Uncharacterised protein [Legionella londiniensis]